MMVAALLTLAAVTPSEAQSGAPATIVGSSSFTRLPDSAGHQRFHLVSQRFLVTRLMDRYNGQSRPLVHEIVDQSCCIDGEKDTQGTITLEGWPSAADASGQPAWHVRIDADEGAIWEEFYKGVLLGCCDETDAQTYVSLKTGAVAFVTSREWDTRDSDIPHLLVPNSSLERWAAFLDGYTDAPFPRSKQDADLVGILQYGPGTQPAARFEVRWSGGSGSAYRLAKVEFAVNDSAQTHGVNVDLWRANAQEDPSSLSGFGIAVHLLGQDINDRGDRAPDVVLTVPVVSDRVRPDLAKIPPGWSVRALKPDN